MGERFSRRSSRRTNRLICCHPGHYRARGYRHPWRTPRHERQRRPCMPHNLRCLTQSYSPFLTGNNLVQRPFLPAGEGFNQLLGVLGRFSFVPPRLAPGPSSPSLPRIASGATLRYPSGVKQRGRVVFGGGRLVEATHILTHGFTLPNTHPGFTRLPSAYQRSRLRRVAPRRYSQP